MTPRRVKYTGRHERRKRRVRLRRRGKITQPISPGQVYVDCSNHDVLCENVIPVLYSRGVLRWWDLLVLYLLNRAHDWDLDGASLVDDSRPRSCSWNHCATYVKPT